MAIKIVENSFSFGSLTTRSKTTRMVVHHVAGDMTVEAIHKLHKDTNGWAGIGYHFVVDKDGTIYRGRPVDKVGAHATGYNSDSVGICFNGNFETETMCDKQKAAGKEVVTYILGLYPTITTIQKHSDVQATACPGKNFPFDEIKVGSSTATTSTNTTTTSTASTDTLYRVRKTWADASSQKGAYESLSNAKAMADKNAGYSVFDASGKSVYTSAETATATTGTSYKVKVTASALNIRKGAGTSYAVTGCIKDKGTYTITEESNGWGKLKSGAGWISLSYTNKV